MSLSRDDKQLLSDYLDGQLPSQNIADFVELLVTDRRAVEQFVELGLVDYLLERHLTSDLESSEIWRDVKLAATDEERQLLAAVHQQLAASSPQSGPLPPPNRKRFGRPLMALAATVLAVAAGALGLWNWRTTDANRADQAGSDLAVIERTLPIHGVATITGSNKVRWSGDLQRTVGEVVAADQPIQIDSGLVELRLRQGADLVLKGPATLTFHTPLRGTLSRGTLTARVEQTAQGLMIDTPNATVVDLGTEFGVSVTEESKTDVVVFQGEVVMRFGQEGLVRQSATPPHLNGRVLLSGDGLRVGSRGVSRLVAIDSSSYPRQLPVAGAAERKYASVIRRVTDNLRESDTAKCYQVVSGGFAEDALAYVDRKHEWNGFDGEGIPGILEGADYVMTFNEDKLVKNIQVNLWLDGPAYLYLLVDDRVPPPNWLQRDFQNTGLKIGLDEGEIPNPVKSTAIGPGKSIDAICTVWMQEFPNGGEVTLGSLEISEQFSSMYGIAATRKTR